MVELGDRLGTCFDKLRRHAGETLLEYTNRFERNYRRLTDAGESLTERARGNRLLKGSGLQSKDQREIIMYAGGKLDFRKIVEVMRLYSRLYGKHHGDSSGQRQRESSGQYRSQQRPALRPQAGRRFVPSGGRRHGVNEVAGDGDVAGDEDDSSEDDDGATPSVLGAEPVANDVNAVGQEEQEDSGAVSEGQAMVCSEDECPIELRCELCNAEVALSQACSVNAVTPVVKQRLKFAQSARSVFRKGGNESGKWRKKEKETIQEIKNRTVCSVCGASGHWHEDPD